MLDYNNELGKTITNVLKHMPKEPNHISQNDLEKILGLTPRSSYRCLEMLYKRDLIMDPTGDWMDSQTKKPSFYVGADWCISMEGINYLENHASWWRRFWVRSIICPIIVSFITAINANNIWTIISEILVWIQSVL